MESTSRASSMSFPENLRPKQKEIIDVFRHRESLVAQLPTGYGKTLAAAGAFAQLRERGAANRMLCVVPRRGQAKQSANDLPENLKKFGINTPAIMVGDDPIRAIKAHNNNSIFVFVVTIQSLLTIGTWATVCDLMRTGRWFVYFDEHHHYGTYADGDGEWTNKINSLSYSAMLAMSATPYRADGADHFGKPEITERYDVAAEGGYVKHLSLHAYEYTIDAVMVDGNVRQFTTDSLADEAGGSTPDAIDAYLLSRKMKFSPKYISPLVTFPCDRMIDLRVRNVRSQMLVQAMSCAHAKCVVDQVRAVLPDHISVDWVATGPNGRRPDENDDVLNRFCPPKDKLTGKRPWTLDVLVNVGMAGEGLDSIDVSEVVFLTSANLTISNKQTIGRGSRLMNVGDELQQPECHVNVDTGSPMAEHLGKQIEKIFDEETIEHPIESDEPAEPPDPKEYQELPETLSATIFDMRLTDIRGLPMFKEIYEQNRRKTDLARTDEEVASLTEKHIQIYLNRSNNASAVYAQKSEQLTSAVSKIAGLVFRRAGDGGLRPDRSMIGDLCRRINSQKKRELGAVPEADGDDLEKHYLWLKNLERQILTKPGFGGVPQWLR